MQKENERCGRAMQLIWKRSTHEASEAVWVGRVQDSVQEVSRAASPAQTALSFAP